MELQRERSKSIKTGLDDPGRVYKILDGGQQFLPLRKPHESVDIQKAGDIISSPENASGLNIRTIEHELDEAVVLCALNSEQSFIPHDKLLEILTPDRVRGIVGGLECFGGHEDKDQIAKEICYGSKNPHKHPCLKLLAALIFLEKIEDIAKHMGDGVSDSCFPFACNSSSGNYSISCKRHGEDHTINEYYRRSIRESFSRWSFRLSAPFIKYREKAHSHYILDSSDVLPIVSIHASRTGGFSVINKVKLHTSQFDLRGHGVRQLSSSFIIGAVPIVHLKATNLRR